MEVALAALTLAGTALAALVWTLKFVLKTFNKTLQEHTKAAISQKESSDEVLRFMKNLNGKLEGAFVAKVEEKLKQK